MRFVIGDIHGEVSKLEHLIEHLLKTDPDPTLIFIGDYLDKGESPREALIYLIYLSKNYECTFLIGNHEYLWLHLEENFEANRQYLLKYGGVRTMASFGSTEVRDTRKKLFDNYEDFFSNLKNYWIDDDFIAVHSGILPKDIDKNPEDIQQINFLFNRYDFIKKQKLFQGKYKVIFGHTGFYYPYVDPYKIGIDTAACFLKYQPLTAFCLDNLHFYNSDKKIYTLDFINIDRCPVIPRMKPWRT